MEFVVGSRLAESENTTSFSGKNGHGASQSAASRGEDSSDESGDTDQDLSATPKQMLNMPETHLNLGMGLNASRGRAIHTKEDYEQRIEKRKLSNRELAKRSRLRRQQECDKLQATASKLQSEISNIPYKLWRLSGECEKLNKENNDIIFTPLEEETIHEIDLAMAQDELEKTYGPDAVSDLRARADSLNGKSYNTEPKTPSRDNSTRDPPMPS